MNLLQDVTPAVETKTTSPAVKSNLPANNLMRRHIGFKDSWLSFKIFRS